MAVDKNSKYLFAENREWIVENYCNRALHLWDLAFGKHKKLIHISDYGDCGKRYGLPCINKRFSHKDLDQILGFSNEDNEGLIRLLDSQRIEECLTTSFENEYAIFNSGYLNNGYRLTIWDMKNKREFGKIEGIKSNFYYWTPIAISNSGNLMVIGNDENNLEVWDTKTRSLIKTLKGHSDRITSIAISSNDACAFSASEDDLVKKWILESGREVKRIKSNSGGVNSILINVNGDDTILVGGKDGSITLWNKKSEKNICKFVVFGDVQTRYLDGKGKITNFENLAWIAITPEGYYNASVNGDRYLNVRIGNKVYGIDQYREKYYRPDIVRLALKLGDTQKAIARLKGDTQGLKAQEQPPKVWFTHPTTTHETDKSSIDIHVKTEDIADTAESVTFYVNHRPLATEKKPVRPVDPGAKVREFSRQIPLAIGENWIEAVARGKAGATQAAMVLVVRKGKQETLPELYYFGAGVSRHSVPALSLRYAAADVTGLADALKRQESRVYSDVNLRTLTDQRATRANILDGVASFFKDARQEDVAILFISGHGMNGATGYHFIAHDTDPDRLSSTGVPWTAFDEVLKTVKSSVLLLADTCHSGNIVGNEKWREQAQADPNAFLRECAKSGVIVFASSSGGTVSREDPSWGHGAFTKALIDGIMGEAAYKKDVVKLSFLQDYVRDTVMELTENTQQPVIPRLTGAGAFLDLVLARAKE